MAISPGFVHEGYLRIFPDIKSGKLTFKVSTSSVASDDDAAAIAEAKEIANEMNGRFKEISDEESGKSDSKIDETKLLNLNTILEKILAGYRDINPDSPHGSVNSNASIHISNILQKLKETYCCYKECKSYTPDTKVEYDTGQTYTPSGSAVDTIIQYLRCTTCQFTLFKEIRDDAVVETKYYIPPPPK